MKEKIDNIEKNMTNESFWKNNDNLKKQKVIKIYNYILMEILKI